MSFRGKRTLLVAGLLVSAMTVSGVAGAEQRLQQDREMQVLLNESATSEERGSSVSNQYGGHPSNDESPDPRPDGKQEDNTTSEDNEAKTSNGKADDEEGGGSSARSDEASSGAGSEPPQGAKPRPETSSDSGEGVISSQDNEPSQLARQSRVSAASRGDAGTEISADRTVQSQKVQRRVRQLEAQERAGEIPRAATGYSTERKPQELRIAREQIVAEPVDEAELRKYKELYEEAAEDYGFGEDWYVLAAVGKVESDHGQNMGPSSAGALGPMQFMPSTWESYGVDGNGDGKANIMDPEDAIPAAAKYLEAGGAPDDWYEALFTYNHAGWYVEEVLEVAEGYRQAAGDEEVGSYYLEDR